MVVNGPGHVIPKTLKMVLDTLLNTQQYKVRIKGKVEQSRERSGSPPHLGVVAILVTLNYGSQLWNVKVEYELSKKEKSKWGMWRGWL